MVVSEANSNRIMLSKQYQTGNTKVTAAMNYGSKISNWYFFEELSRTVGAQVAEDWFRGQKAIARSSGCCKNQISEEKVSRPSVVSKLLITRASAPRPSKLSSFGEPTNMSIRDEAGEMRFPQTILSQPIEICRARDTSSLLSSSPRTVARLTRACSAASPGLGATCDRHRRSLPGRSARPLLTVIPFGRPGRWQYGQCHPALGSLWTRIGPLQEARVRDAPCVLDGPEFGEWLTQARGCCPTRAVPVCKCHPTGPPAQEL